MAGALWLMMFVGERLQTRLLCATCCSQGVCLPSVSGASIADVEACHPCLGQLAALLIWQKNHMCCLGDPRGCVKEQQQAWLVALALPYVAECVCWC